MQKERNIADLKAYGLIEVREVSDEARTITGIATTPTIDSYGDIVEPLGVQYRGPVNLYLYHKHYLPVGNVEFGKATKAGIPFTAKLPDVKEEGVVRERVNEARHSLKYKLLQAVSIGFLPIEYERIDETGGLRFKSWAMTELSLVGIPANPDAVIHTVRSAGFNADIVRELRMMDVAAGKSRGIPLIKSREGSLSRGAVELIRR